VVHRSSSANLSEPANLAFLPPVSELTDVTIKASKHDGDERCHQPLQFLNTNTHKALAKTHG